MELQGKIKFQLVGNLTKIIARSDDVSSALIKSMNFLTSYKFADLAIAWIKDTKDTNILRPVFSASPLDITCKTINKGDGIVGRVYKDDKPRHIADYQDFESDSNNADDVEQIKEIFGDNNFSSMICTPLHLSDGIVGCIQCILTQKDKKFSDEDFDILQLFSSTLSYFLEDTCSIFSTWKYPEVVLSGRDIQKDFVNAGMTTKVLKGINIDIYKGEFVVLLGESGCGKTTLLNILGGLDKPTSGTLFFKDINLTNMSEKELTEYRRENIGFVFQSYNLMPNINVKQNIDLISELADNPKDTLEVLKLVKIENLSKNFPSQLSGGQQQRVSIARAVAKNPKIIMADEPTAALDYETSLEVLEVFEDVVKDGSTLVMVTHNEEIAKIANRVVRFRNGKVYNIQINPSPAKVSSLVW